MEVEEITLTFENCETMTFPRNVIGGFIITNIGKMIARLAANSISDYMYANTVVLEIFSEGNTDYHPFEIFTENDKKFDRIRRYHDITHIDIKYEDETIETYSVDYFSNHKGLGEENLYQHSYISSLGNLYIVIEKDKTVDDYFDKDEIEDKEYVEFVREMFDIGETD